MESEARGMLVKRCPTCGRLYPRSYRFCIVCGSVLRLESGGEATPETSP